jgi:hypothetical protein
MKDEDTPGLNIGLYTFEPTEEHNDIGHNALRLILQRLDLQRANSKNGGPDDAAMAIGCAVMLLCDFISDCYQPPTARKQAVERVLDIVLAMIAHSSFADENAMALAVRKFIGEMFQKNLHQ